ncbi:hypothetical protein HG536_0H04410 [Torulaspora globosa]|uniref:Sorting nexin MVP1 n=1 Tax=Torulaspora globosa TaxID=48254 RepID=A0A7G3ZNH9_9SACH|nr:uncharacterized protein HG536_0H04410 [Torulaspora globosa]QLL35065.1 hypothetical protein HG536_0H04410 [Torulaspora globosa]
MDALKDIDPWNTNKDEALSGNEWTSGDGAASIAPLAETSRPSLDASIRNISVVESTEASDTLGRSTWEEELPRNTDILSEATLTGSGSSLLGPFGSTDFSVTSRNFQEPHHSLDENLSDWLKTVRGTYKPLGPDIVVIEQLPDKEGLLFKHTNYLVRHLVALPHAESNNDRSVIRRYSDFVWLQEVLLKRYPFRLIPELPPKKIGTQNADAVFLERRRRGLTRFINLVVKHPVLSKDDLLLTFLTVPTDLSGWRKQAIYDTTEEFSDKKITHSFVKMWQKEISEQWNESEATIEKSIELWVKITVSMERYERRVKFMAKERAALGSLIHEFSVSTPKLYPTEQSSTVLEINNHLSIIEKHLKETTELSNERTAEYSTNLVPSFRVFIDILISLRDLFERYRIMAGNNVPLLQRRVELNNQKLESMKDKPDVSGAEYDRIKSAIQRDKRTIAEELNRAWLIRECILEEFTIFQETQFLISRAFQEWSKLNSNYAGRTVNAWEKLSENLMDMPTSQN